jgi:hypothetical protein
MAKVVARENEMLSDNFSLEKATEEGTEAEIWGTGTRGNSEQVIGFREGMGVMEVEGVIRSPLQIMPSNLATGPKLKFPLALRANLLSPFLDLLRSHSGVIHISDGQRVSEHLKEKKEKKELSSEGKVENCRMEPELKERAKQ